MMLEEICVNLHFLLQALIEKCNVFVMKLIQRWSMEIQVNMIEKLPGRLVLSDYNNDDDNNDKTIATSLHKDNRLLSRYML